MLLTLLAVRDSGQVWLVLVVTFLYGLSGTTISGAQTALMKNLVPAEQLADANGLQQTLQQVMRLVTPALGIGVLAWCGGHVVALADAATFLLAAACLATVRISEPKAVLATDSRAGWLSEAGTGFRVIWRSPVLRQTTSASAVMFFIFGIFVPLGLQVSPSACTGRRPGSPSSSPSRESSGRSGRSRPDRRRGASATPASPSSGWPAWRSAAR
jgi:Transmembrane secretion effector